MKNFFKKNWFNNALKITSSVKIESLERIKTIYVGYLKYVEKTEYRQYLEMIK
jgi:hypothetical protein